MRNTLKTMILLATAMLTACGENKEVQQKQHEDERPIVKLQTVKTQTVPQIQEYSATVEAEVVNNIAPSVPVRIDRILVEVGDRVKVGQQLVAMDQAKLKQLEFQLRNKEVEFKRTDELYKIGGVSKSEWDAVKMAYDVQKTACKDLKENTTLVSPINGVVTARNYDNGDLYSGAAPVVVVQQITPVKLLIHVSENHFTEVKVGQPVDIRLDVYGNEIFKGKISLIYPTINPSSRTFTVEITMENRDLRVRPGMFARATLNFGEKEHVVVPDLAVVKQHGAGDHYVYVYKNGKVSYNKVELGRRMNDQYELISGVPDSAQVVIAGQSRLANGIEVNIEK